MSRLVCAHCVRRVGSDLTRALQRAIGVYGMTGEHPLECTSGTDEAREVIAEVVLAGRYAKPHHTDVERRLRRGEAHVGGERDSRWRR